MQIVKKVLDVFTPQWYVKISVFSIFFLQPAINVLLNLIKKTEIDASSDKKKKKKEGDLLLRPIICVCNDQ